MYAKRIMDGLSKAQLTRAFASTDAWVFDLDNTLYPAHSNLFAQIDRRMSEYVARLLEVPVEEARVLQKQYYQAYGTTLNGLMAVHGIDPAPYLDYVHDLDLSGLAPDPALARALSNLPGRKIIFTNGSRGHAERVAEQLGVAHLFDGVSDIVTAEFWPKPYTQAYDKMLKDHAIAPERAAFFEDLPRNLEPAHALGMKTILVKVDHPWRRDGPVESADRTHVDFEIEDLTEFLSLLTE